MKGVPLSFYSKFLKFPDNVFVNVVSRNPLFDKDPTAPEHLKNEHRLSSHGNIMEFETIERYRGKIRIKSRRNVSYCQYTFYFFKVWQPNSCGLVKFHSLGLDHYIGGLGRCLSLDLKPRFY